MTWQRPQNDGWDVHQKLRAEARKTTAVMMPMRPKLATKMCFFSTGASASRVDRRTPRTPDRGGDGPFPGCTDPGSDSGVSASPGAGGVAAGGPVLSPLGSSRAGSTLAPADLSAGASACFFLRLNRLIPIPVAGRCVTVLPGTVSVDAEEPPCRLEEGVVPAGARFLRAHRRQVHHLAYGPADRLLHGDSLAVVEVGDAPHRLPNLRLGDPGGPALDGGHH